MASPGDLFRTDICEKIPVQCLGKINAQPAALIALDRKTEPRLLNLWEAVPATQERIVYWAALRFVPQENQVLNHRIMQCLIFRFFTVEQKKWINKKRKISNERDIKSAVAL